MYNTDYGDGYNEYEVPDIDDNSDIEKAIEDSELGDNWHEEY